MKQVKFFLIVGVVLLFIAAGTVGYVWFKIQNTLQATPIEAVQHTVEFVPSEATPIANTVPDKGINIDTSSVSHAQKATAQKIGVDLDAVTITPAMVACGEQTLGSARTQEIIDGATPTTLESMSLLRCL